MVYPTQRIFAAHKTTVLPCPRAIINLGIARRKKARSVHLVRRRESQLPRPRNIPIRKPASACKKFSLKPVSPAVAIVKILCAKAASKSIITS